MSCSEPFYPRSSLEYDGGSWTTSPEIHPPSFVHAENPNFSFACKDFMYPETQAGRRPPQIRNRIHRTDRGCLAQLCPLCREGSQRPSFAGICLKSDSPRSPSSHSKCRWCCPGHWEACLAGHWFCGAKGGIPRQTQPASSRVRPAPLVYFLRLSPALSL